MYTTEQLIAVYEKMDKENDFYDFAVEIGQEYATRKNWDGLIKVYRDAIDKIDIKQRYRDEINNMDYDGFESTMLECLEKAVQLAEQHPKTQAIYFEFDIEAACFFLCNSYDRNDDEWAANWEYDVLAPALEPESDMLVDEEMKFRWLILLSDYFYAHCCATIGKCKDNYPGGFPSKYPLAMAKHDYDLIYYS